jgi:holin-like protein
MIRAFGILVGFQFVGNAIVELTGIPIPGNVVGMVLLAFGLSLGWIRSSWVESAAQLLIDNLSFLFVPAGVGVMSYFGVISREWLAISLSIVGSLVLVLIVTGKSCEAVAGMVKAATGRSSG